MEQGMWCETCVRARGAVLSLVVALLAACGPAAALDAVETPETRAREQAITAALQANLNRLSGQYGNSGVGLQRKVMERAAGIMQQNRPYIFDGVQDCYGFVRQVWNAILYDGGTHPEDYYPNAYSRSRWHNVSGGLPVNDAPSGDWERITDWNELVPGDVLSTQQGHAWGDTWHGGIFAGRGADGAFYVYDNSSSMNGAYRRVYTGFSYFHRRIHDLLIQAAPTPGVATLPDGRLEVFMRGRTGPIYHAWQVTPNGGFGGWYSLGGALAGNPVVGRNQDGRLSVFVRGPSKDLWNINQQPGGSWSGWSGLAGRTNYDPAVATNLDGRMTLASRGNNGEVYTLTQTAVNSAFGGWVQLGGGTVTNRPTLASWQDGRLELYGRAIGGNVLRRPQGAPNGSFGAWASLEGEIRYETVARRHSNGRVYLFVRGMNDELFYTSQAAPNGSWGGWVSLGGPVTSDAAVEVNTDGSMDVFVRGTAENLYTRRLKADGTWSGWVNLLGATASNPATGRFADGRVAVFILGNNGVLHMRRQDTPSSSVWADWEVVGDAVSRF